MTTLAQAGFGLLTLACLLGALWILARLVSWPAPAGRLIAGYVPRRFRPQAPAPEYSPADLAVRTRGVVVADLVVVSPAGDEVLVAGRSLDEAAELYRELTGQAWTREAAERTAARRSAA